MRNGLPKTPSFQVRDFGAGVAVLSARGMWQGNQEKENFNADRWSN